LDTIRSLAAGKSTLIERGEGEYEELSGGSARREAREQLLRMRKELEDKKLDESRGDRLADQRRQDPLQDEILSVLSKMAGNIEAMKSAAVDDQATKSLPTRITADAPIPVKME
jgi:hypothetical protein